MAELHHRIANSFQIASGLLARQAEQAKGDAAAALRMAEAQLQAFALLHETLLVAPTAMEICAATYLRRLCKHLDQACVAPHARTLYFHAPQPAPLPHDACRTLGLIVTELVLNALKHAFPGRETGAIAVMLRFDQCKARFALMIADDGVGFSDDLASPRNGLDFVRRLAQAARCDCECTTGPGGTRFLIYTQDR